MTASVLATGASTRRSIIVRCCALKLESCTTAPCSNIFRCGVENILGTGSAEPTAAEDRHRAKAGATRARPAARRSIRRVMRVRGCRPAFLLAFIFF